MKWRVGGIEDPGREEPAPIHLPDDIDYAPVPAHRTLSEIIATGDIDAMIRDRAPSCFMRGMPNVSRRFPDCQRVEEDFFRKTRILPITHLIGIQRSLMEKRPWLPVSVYKAFVRGTQLCTDEMANIGQPVVTLPWSVHEYERMRALMGDGFWAYGIEPNRDTLDTLARYSFE